MGGRGVRERGRQVRQGVMVGEGGRGNKGGTRAKSGNRPVQLTI